MNEEVKLFLDRVNKIMENKGKFFYYTRAQEFQTKSLQIFKKILEESIELKEKMIKAQDEESANIMLSLEFFINCLINELEMLILLKKDKPNEAWDCLIKAQNFLRMSLQTSDIIKIHGEINYIEKLQLIEKIIFPPQTFNSIEAIIESSVCSICGEEYGKCEHIAGKAYMGKLCSRVIKKIKDIKGLAITKEPASKLHRINAFYDDEGWRDIMTWRIIKKENRKK